MRALGEEPELPQRDLGGELAVEDAALDEHRDGGQGQPDGGNARRRAGGRLVADQAVGRVGLVEVVQQRRRLELVQEFFRRGRVDHRARVLPFLRRECVLKV